MESQTTEYKQQWDDKYLAYISGFANAQGGTIYVGVDDNGIVKGLSNAKKLMEDIPNKVHDTMGMLVSVNLLQNNGLEYIQIVVPACSMPITYRGKYYFRSGSTLQELGGVALHDFLLQKMNLSWDAMPLPAATFGDLDRSAIDYFLHCAVDAKRLSSAALHDTTPQVIKNLRLMNDQGQLTMAALLLFGKDILKWCGNAQFRIGRFGVDVADLITQDSIACPLILMPDRIIEVLRSKYLITPIHYEGLLRKEPLELPEEGLREILCNAIVHRNYMGVDTQMKVFNDHITLWNDGGLPTNFTIETLMNEHESRPRNKLIAKVFHLAGFIETWGRGYEKITKAFVSEGLQVPVFAEVRGGISATIKRERFMEQEGKKEHLDNENCTKDCTINCTKDFIKENESELTERQKDILLVLAEDNILSAPKIALKIALKKPVSERTIKYELSILQKKGIIRHVGGRKLGYWKLLFLPS